MNIHESTESYEAWLTLQLNKLQLAPDHAALNAKHLQMQESAFQFLRATFYRWVEVWPEVAPELRDAPTVLAVGDLHIENFGTWRDVEGRLVWGMNDFDEAHTLPYTCDLLRLATSLRLAMEEDDEYRPRRLRKLCNEILGTYTKTLSDGRNDTTPLVLSEENTWLRHLAVEQLCDPDGFWKKLDRRPIEFPNAKEKVQNGTEPLRKVDVPAEVRGILMKSMPPGFKVTDWRRRTAGLGSLGRPRYVLLGYWQGGRVAREAKALLPSAVVWAQGLKNTRSMLKPALERAVRCSDPYQQVMDPWTIRRLGPDCDKLDIDKIPDGLADNYLRAMGVETANIHLGSRNISAVLSHLESLPEDWLAEAAEERVKRVKKDWKEWKKG